MCGIAGVLRLDGGEVDESELSRMSGALAHRGPDGNGTFAERGLGLAHRRLAVIDTSDAGRQPMHSGDGRHVIVYNGEVYNFGELRPELERRGHQFRSGTDTEVVLAAYREWGPDCVRRFNGMFAFAIWDRHERTLFLARDRYGIKPLYYAFTPACFLFASEQKALHASASVPARVDVQALVEYFTFQNLLTDRTLLEGVRLFPAGSWTTVRAADAPGLQPTRYWTFDFSEPREALDPDECLEELDRLFREAVRRQLVSDVPVGAYLSGGTDSGSITAVAATHLPRLSTFTCGFDLRGTADGERSFDERASAELMAHAFDTEHYEVVLKASDMEHVLPSLAWHLEEPRVGQSYPNWFAARLASRFVTVVLSGTGGDELFAGYPWRYAPLVGDGTGGVDAYYSFWQRLFDDDARTAAFGSAAAGASPRDIFDSVYPAPPHDACPAERLNAALTFEAKTFLHGLLLVDDKLSMAHGLETRVPFLDNDLVDFAMAVPASLKTSLVANGGRRVRAGGRTAEGKRILRRMMARYVPPEISSKEKQGFSGPDASWFRGASRDWVLRTLFGPDARIATYLDAGVVRRFVCEHMDGRANRRLLIWSLLNVEHWLRQYL